MSSVSFGCIHCRIRLNIKHQQTHIIILSFLKMAKLSSCLATLVAVLSLGPLVTCRPLDGETLGSIQGQPLSVSDTIPLPGVDVAFLASLASSSDPTSLEGSGISINDLIPEDSIQLVQ